MIIIIICATGNKLYKFVLFLTFEYSFEILLQLSLTRIDTMIDTLVEIEKKFSNFDTLEKWHFAPKRPRHGPRAAI